jgi:hypothetical protein
VLARDGKHYRVLDLDYLSEQREEEDGDGDGDGDGEDVEMSGL